MPVRSSVCAYSPSTVTNSKYSTVLPASSPIGHYKPLSSLSSSYATGAIGSSSNRLASAASYSPATGATSRYGSSSALANRYSASSYSPHSSASLATGSHSSLSSNNSSTLTTSGYSSSGSPGGSSVGHYRPLSTHNSFTGARYGAGASTYGRYSSASSTGSASSSSLSSAGSSLLDRDHLSSSTTGYSSYSGGSYHTLRRPSSSSISSLSSTSSSQLPSGVPGGLINLGNTCYMNAALQSLYSVESFRNLVLRGQSGAYDKPLTCELAALFKSMKTGAAGAPLSPANFKCAFSRYQQKFSGLGQQDAQEFLRYLVNGVHEEWNQAGHRPRRSTPARPPPRSAQEAWSLYREIVDDSPLVDLVVGQMCSTIQCSVCQGKSNCWDPFWDLSLPLVRRDSARYSCRLAEVVQDFVAKETLDSDERPVCSHCKRATRSTKQISLCRLPPLIILHLKKFTNDGYKMTSPEVRVDTRLTLGDSATSYQLQACISHHGHSASSGHYTSHCKYSSRWFHFNDDRVRDVTSSFDSAKLNDAYVLFYTQSSAAAALDQSKL